MNLKEKRKEFYKLLEELTGVKIPAEKISYISEALKEYAKSSNEKCKEKIDILENKIEKMKTSQPSKVIKKQIIQKERPSTIRVWDPNQFKSSINK